MWPNVSIFLHTRRPSDKQRAQCNSRSRLAQTCVAPARRSTATANTLIVALAKLITPARFVQRRGTKQHTSHNSLITSNFWGVKGSSVYTALYAKHINSVSTTPNRVVWLCPPLVPLLCVHTSVTNTEIKKNVTPNYSIEESKLTMYVYIYIYIYIVAKKLCPTTRSR